MTPIITLFFFALITIAALVESFADALFEKWSLVGKGHFLAAGLAIYFLSSVFWAWSLKYETLSKGIVIFNVVNILVGVIVGVMYFKEVLTATNVVGIFFGIVSVILLSI